MPAPVQPVYPALYLYPLNDSFVPKHISLAHNQRVKIGRQTNAKTAPGEKNGYFDSKVLSRQHAEVWEENGQIYIKDVKSSNGTFINGERLSNEGIESEPFVLKSDDIVEFGIDIVSEDNKTIIHHKVAARVVCVFTDQDVQVATRAEQLQQQHLQQYQPSSPSPSQIPSPSSSGGPSNGPNNNFNFAQGQQQRRQPAVAQGQGQGQGIMGMGGMGGGMRPPGKSGLTFEHILSRLQGELQKSRETGAELHTLSGAMSEIQDTLGGNLPANLPSYPSNLPPVRHPQQQSQQHQQQQVNEASTSTSSSPQQPSTLPPSTALLDLQTQLTSHVDKIRALEGVLVEQESIKQEIKSLREMMEEKRREHELVGGFIGFRTERDGEDAGGGGGYSIIEPGDLVRIGMGMRGKGMKGRGEGEGEGEADDDDVRSIGTIVPHELERVEEEDEEELEKEEKELEVYRKEHPEVTVDTQMLEDEAAEREREHERQRELEHQREHEHEHEEDEDEDDEGRRRRNDELGRPTTPEPTNLGMRSGATRLSPLSQVAATGTGGGGATEEAFEQVLKQVGALMALTTTLEAQHSAAQETISALESKVVALEATVRATQEAAAVKEPPPVAEKEEEEKEKEKEKESLTAMVLEWKKSMEGQWSSVREDWDKERERLNAAREQWEGQVRAVDSRLERLEAGGVGDGLRAAVNGDVRDASKHIGLATPPSPRSLSSDSNRPRRRRTGRGRAHGGGGRTRTRSGSGSKEREGDTDTDATLASEEASLSKEGVLAKFGVGHRDREEVLERREEDGDGEDEDEEEEEEEDTVLGVRSKSQVHGENGNAITGNGNGAGMLATPDSSVYKLPPKDVAATAAGKAARDLQTIQLQTAIGVLVLGAAAAAVFWRVKPET
ncbi:hypothetical protein Hypma_002244 [Hypsizygus marmoreus]|uniref:FHA domain-containing protein n=1 Tax=Hypsizygus marmoreus TaxID=39966 RepID=A0A369K074_HYPMA|nr:hypothetical protein Hypma_002244 [Hypsizygus marmoreus]